ncbi:MAG: hypothetical protein DRP93_06060 [Candidatus Neomarinimicrobiota bacterium]|nr:MAG: hypothetical protein DRP93_06060 [Candidatus Neomarinimicrobiota bacterium]
MKKIRIAKVGQVKANKYGNRKTTIDGYKFDSAAEAKHYTQLKMLLRAGKIQNLVLQPGFVLQEAFTLNGKRYQEIKYISDFKYIELDGTVVITDVKGKITPEYALKKKMFLKIYGVEVKFIELMIKDI